MSRGRSAATNSRSRWTCAEHGEPPPQPPRGSSARPSLESMSTSVQTSFLPDDAPEAAALARAAALRGTPGSFDELHGVPAEAASAGAALAPEWSAFFDATGADGWVDLAQARARIRSRVQDDGVTYNVYAEGAAAASAWPLEP